MKARCTCGAEFVVHPLYHDQVRKDQKWYCPWPQNLKPEHRGKPVLLTILEDNGPAAQDSSFGKGEQKVRP